MIAAIESKSPAEAKVNPESFLLMLPGIRRQAEWAFGKRCPEAREEFVQQVVASAYCAFCRLVKQGKKVRRTHPHWRTMQFGTSEPVGQLAAE